MNAVRELRRQLDNSFPGRYELDVGAERTAIILIIDPSFSGKTRQQRVMQIEPLLDEAGLRPGITELYTPAEADERGIALSTDQIIAPATWDTAVSMVESGQRPVDVQRPQRKPRRVIFYSYKGGVGRTTALVHTAFHLARAGKRVAVIDLDVEAPGLHTVLPRSDRAPIVAGLVDYLWERQIRPFDEVTDECLETCLVGTPAGQAKAISYAVEDPVARAQVQVIPAGAVGDDYVRRLHTLSFEDVLTRSDDAWALFEQELAEQLDPDFMLIDARTGLGDWGGLSLLRLADEAFLVLYPSDQNGEGIRFVRGTLTQLREIPTHLVLSPIPEGPLGRKLVDQFLPQLGLEEDDEQPVEIHYNPGIASAGVYPVETAMASYARLANLILESETEDRVEATIQRTDRWKIIESLSFPQREAKAIAANDFELFFQKTSDFDKFLDDARWVVRGRKGTGKSTLFHLFVEHQENAVKRARGRLEGIDVLPGHGPAVGAEFRPTTDVFNTIRRKLIEGEDDWLSLWRAYAIIRVFCSVKRALVESLLKGPDMKALHQHLFACFTVEPGGYWRSTHTTGLLELLGEPFKGLCRDLMIDLNTELGRAGRKLWLLYDDLDQDIKEESSWQGEALSGLLRLAYDSNNQGLHNVRFKVFLREDIWSALVFTNKSHFGDPRTLELKWNRDDFLRLAYRLATGASAEFRALAQRQFPLTDTEVDSAGEEDLRRALAPLWGLNQEKGKKAFAARWVYSRMTDSQDNTYPRSLTVLLNTAREEELRRRNDKQVPSDRLFSRPSMQAGLKSASEARVNELKNEFPKLRPFLDYVKKDKALRSQFSRGELETAWKKTSPSEDATLDSFIAQLDTAGLLVKKARGATYDFGIASLYIDGLGITRVQGENK
ncbi:P-loop NTPase [uncultured Thiodictyon sp.]|uniref:tyrosine-protein kinase family protein n=1 Tax=uncultured Thiodictyon sp. TaxID=1846217 RepID=UPI0025F31F42|nr:P-loop NTPase [uncultured Thiodictyon sp.]